MKISATDTTIASSFPPSPIAGSDLLVPIKSWLAMFREAQVTGVEFDEFWYKHVECGVAYFFSWLGAPRSTVLVVWDDAHPTHIECRAIGDTLVSEIDAAPIVTEITHRFRQAGFWQNQSTH